MDYIKKYIDLHFTEERKRHTYGVAEMAKSLAKQYGANEQKAETAALFHDLYKSVSKEKLDFFVKHLNLGKQYQDNVNLAHGKIAAYVMERDYGIKDEDILNAVQFHTTGRAGMSTLEKIIYLADAIEPGRSYPEVEQMRQIAFINLDEACLRVLERTIEYVTGRGFYLDHDTVLARDYLREKRRECMDSKEIALFAARLLDQKKAMDVMILDIGAKSSFADYFVLASGGSERQIGTLCGEVEEKFAKDGMYVKHIEGKQTSGWILMDYGDVIINLFTVEMRQRYNIEKVWGDCDKITLEDQDEQR